MRFGLFAATRRLDKHQQVTPFANSQRSSFGGDTSVSSPKSLAAERDATDACSGDPLLAVVRFPSVGNDVPLAREEGPLRMVWNRAAPLAPSRSASGLQRCLPCIDGQKNAEKSRHARQSGGRILLHSVTFLAWSGTKLIHMENPGCSLGMCQGSRWQTRDGGREAPLLPLSNHRPTILPSGDAELWVRPTGKPRAARRPAPEPELG